MTYVRVVEHWQRNSFDVYVFSERPTEAALQMPTFIERHVEGNVWRREEVGEPEPFTGLPKPSFSLPRPVLEELIQQAQKIAPSLSRDDAVSDARATRDRLLTLIESQFDVGRPDSPTIRP